MAHVGTLAQAVDVELAAARGDYKALEEAVWNYGEPLDRPALAALVEQYRIAHERYLELLHVWDHLRSVEGLEARLAREGGG